MFLLFVTLFLDFSILEHIEDSRKKIEQELKELLKLCSWERLESFLSIENSKRTRQKFKKLIQKYNVSDSTVRCFYLSVNILVFRNFTNEHKVIY